MSARAGAPGPPGPRPVDVVLPVFGPSEDLARCLDSVRRHTDLTRQRLVVVADGPLWPEPERLVAALASRAPSGVVRLGGGDRVGYVASVNAGMRFSDRDVVLLNSDTEVTAGWVEKLRAAASSGPDVATATPFSNNATICSLPRPLVENALPAGHTVDSFAQLVEAASERRYPELPTAVGFCMYLRRDALEDVGPFDEARFGLGYGEENDFCERAGAKGWRHVLDDATFVFHRGGGSFGAESTVRIRRALRVLARLHPGYFRRISRFLREDTLAPVRSRVVQALRPLRPRMEAQAPARVAHLVHGWPPHGVGGTEVYARALALAQAGHREVAVYARLADPGRRLGEALELEDSGIRVRLVVNNFLQRDPVSRAALHERAFSADFGAFLDDFRPDLLHVHHLAGHAATLPLLARRRGIPVVFQLQDWFTVCARVNLLHAEGRRCPGPSPLACASCRPLTGVRPSRLLSAGLHLLRSALMRRALDADRLIAGSRFLAGSFRELGLPPGGAAIEVIPYGVCRLPEPTPARTGVPSLPLRFGFVGALMPHKGAHVAVEAFRGLPPDRARLRVWGDPSQDPEYAAGLGRDLRGADVALAGRFPEERKAEVFAGIDVLLVPSTGLESYGIVVDEAMAHGVPVVASRDGALPERYPETCGAFVSPGDAAGLRAWVERLAARPERVSEWRRALPPVATFEEGHRRIEEVYASLFPSRGRV